MRALRVYGLVAAAMFCLLLPGQIESARADGSTRLATAQERAFYSKVVGAANKAIPSPPPGWEVVFQTELDAPDRVVVGLEDGPYSITYNAEWLNRPAHDKMEAQRGKLLESAAATMTTDTGDEALIKQIEALAAQAGKAAERGDYAETQKIQKQMEQVAEKLNARMETKASGVEEMMARTAVQDIGAMISVQFNFFNVALPENVKRLPVLDGIKLVFRAPGEDQYTGEVSEHGVTTVLLGKGWKEVSDGDNHYLESPEEVPGPHTAVHTIVVEIQASDDRAADIVKNIDWNHLKTLLVK